MGTRSGNDLIDHFSAKTFTAQLLGHAMHSPHCTLYGPILLAGFSDIAATQGIPIY
jgi:hypothetical protein